ncbi:hypothetical protein STVIR_7702 [Streptomyces viridochromogenes Tue57]|uniref:Transposase n=1 Tax=Streptomyces viridochromogenes Tue57 TaxID=1160705 RepID=L8P5B1_STRVR|nr:hypothetical protein STVIR_7702 [Streptomyces viridochromogenes Tue57]
MDGTTIHATKPGDDGKPTAAARYTTGDRAGDQPHAPRRLPRLAAFTRLRRPAGAATAVDAGSGTRDLVSPG